MAKPPSLQDHRAPLCLHHVFKLRDWFHHWLCMSAAHAQFVMHQALAQHQVPSLTLSALNRTVLAFFLVCAQNIAD